VTKKKTLKNKSVHKPQAEIVKESMIKNKGSFEPIHLGDERSDFRSTWIALS